MRTLHFVLSARQGELLIFSYLAHMVLAVIDFSFEVIC